jgi:CRISPR-associated protein Csd2
MLSLQNKIDFALIFHVKNANPNGDPLNGNRPRTDYSGFGEITDVCIKRKIRDRLLESGRDILVQADDRKIDDEPSIRSRAESDRNGLGKPAFGNHAKKDETIKKACDKWFDVRTFGHVFALTGNTSGRRGRPHADEADEGDAGGVSIPVRGPVTIQSAFSVEPISTRITSTQIVKSASGEGDGTKRSSDTMGMKHRVDHGIYVCFGSMNPQLAERTRFSDDDAETIKAILPKLFENDASSARPEGSMRVGKLIWWKHGSKAGKYSSARVHGSLKVHSDGTFELKKLDGLEAEIIDGF